MFQGCTAHIYHVDFHTNYYMETFWNTKPSAVCLDQVSFKSWYLGGWVCLKWYSASFPDVTVNTIIFIWHSTARANAQQWPTSAASPSLLILRVWLPFKVQTHGSHVASCYINEGKQFVCSVPGCMHIENILIKNTCTGMRKTIMNLSCSVRSKDLATKIMSSHVSDHTCQYQSYSHYDVASQMYSIVAVAFPAKPIKPYHHTTFNSCQARL